MDPLQYLFALDQFGIKLGLRNITAIAEALGRPQTRYRTVLVGGTNGKGSVTAFVEAALRAAGHRTGRYTSPHLVRLEERFVVDGQPVAHEPMCRAIADVRDAGEALRRAGTLDTAPTFFEVTTAVAFELFRRAGVDIAVLEVGLGGRFDATNIVDPLSVAITNVDLDHQRYLGDTIPQIAAEKAGIVKPGVPVVLGETHPDAREVVARVCRERGARLVPAGEGVHTEVDGREGRVQLAITTPRRRYGPVWLALRGRHQVQNAVVAVRLLEEIEGAGVPVAGEAVEAGLSRAEWRGRLELVAGPGGRAVLLDAAHNPAGAAALAAYLREAHPAGLPVVFGVMQDKDLAGIVGPIAPCATHVIGTAPAVGRALPAAALAGRLRALTRRPVLVEPSPMAALERAWTLAPLAAVTGSIFLVGEILGALERVERADR